MSKNKKIMTAGIWLYGLACVTSNANSNQSEQNVSPVVMDKSFEQNNGIRQMKYSSVVPTVIPTLEPTVEPTVKPTEKPKATKEPTKEPKATQKAEKKAKKTSATKSPAKTNKSTSNDSTTKLYNSIPLSARFQRYIDEKCKDYGLSTNVVMGVIKKESSFNTTIMGDNGEAYGLMQVQKKWHRSRMRKLGVTDLLECYNNVSVGIDYLAELYRANGGNWHKTLMAYNGGQAYANRRTSTYYSRTVMKYAEQFKKERND